MEEKLKVGILIDDHVINKWEYKILTRITDSETSVLTLVIKDMAKPGAQDSPQYPLIYRYHEKIDSRLFRHKFDYDNKIDLTDLMAGIPSISIDTSSENVSFGEAGQNTDVLLNFGVRLTNKHCSNLPRYGIWFYRIGGSGQARDHFAGYWETINNLPVIEGAVYMLRPDGTETELYRTNSPTYPESIHQVRDRIYASASVVIPRILKGVYDNGDVYIEHLTLNLSGEYDESPPELLKPPSSLKALGNLFKLARKKIARNLYPDLWFLILGKHQEGEFPFHFDTDQFIKLSPPRDVFWADPFIVCRDDKYYLFIEEYVYKTNKGHISVLEVDKNGHLLASESIMKQAYHMSFPFVFEWEDEYYMMPETMQNKTIGLYRCKKFPYEWEHVLNLMENVTAVDSTLFYHNQKWWLFTSIDETETREKPFNELFLFYSDDLLSGDWKSHPENPIVTDLRFSRQAGKIVEYDGKIYRPSQDCSERYGRAMKIHQITKLDENDYEESMVVEIEPTWAPGLMGTHTINFDGRSFVLDACERYRRIRRNN